MILGLCIGLVVGFCLGFWLGAVCGIRGFSKDLEKKMKGWGYD